MLRTNNKDVFILCSGNKSCSRNACFSSFQYLMTVVVVTMLTFSLFDVIEYLVIQQN
jgi:hypothetical protein